MSTLSLTLLRFGFLAVLWLFVITAISVMRSDLFGTRVAAKGSSSRPPRQAKPPKPRRARRPGALVVTNGPLAGTRVGLADAPVTIGRAPDCTLVLDDDYASQRHARLYQHEGQWVVEDLGSTNGTYLDRAKVVRPTLVPFGMPIRIGKTVVEIRK